MVHILHAYTLASQVVHAVCCLDQVFPLALDCSTGLVVNWLFLLVESLRVEQAFFSLGWVLSKLGAQNVVPGWARVPGLLPFYGRQVVGVALQRVAQ